MNKKIYWVYIKHGDPVYGGGVVCFSPTDHRPAPTAIKCQLCQDGKFHVLENFEIPYVRGYVVPAENIAFFLKDGDEYLATDALTSKYVYEIFSPGINRSPCQQPFCGFHNPTVGLNSGNDEQ